MEDQSKSMEIDGKSTKINGNHWKTIKTNSGRSQNSATEHLGFWASQHLSFSASQLSVLVSWESLAEVSKGCNVPCTEKKVSSRALPGHGTHRSPPSTFLLLLPIGSKIAQMARCCRRSCQRIKNWIRFSTFLTRLIERLISDRDPLEANWRKLSKWGGGSPNQ